MMRCCWEGRWEDYAAKAYSYFIIRKIINKHHPACISGGNKALELVLVDAGQSGKVLPVVPLQSLKVFGIQHAIHKQFEVKSIRVPLEIFLKSLPLHSREQRVHYDRQQVLQHIWHESIQQ
jgi:hypothetical protein